MRTGEVARMKLRVCVQSFQVDEFETALIAFERLDLEMIAHVITHVVRPVAGIIAKLTKK